MGVLNRTPDSFSDGGRFVDDGAALAHADRMIAEGATIIDVGAESTRPRAPAVAASVQIERLGGVIGKLASRALVSIDTTSPEVARFAIDEGASIINSVSLEPAAELGAIAAERGASLVLMHCRGAMTDMRGFSQYADDAYGDVVRDVTREWIQAAESAIGAGLASADLVLDPGLGFAKNARQSLELVARLDELVALGFPVMVGPSRKSFIARAAGDDAGPEARLGGSVAATLACVERGAAIVRVHDVAPIRQALAVARAIASASPREKRIDRDRAEVIRA